MNEQQLKTWNEWFYKLPRITRHVISDINWQSQVKGISYQHSLSEENADKFETETGLLLVSITEAANFSVNLQDQIGISSQFANTLVNEAEQRIFSPIYEKLLSSIRAIDVNNRKEWDDYIDELTEGKPCTTKLSISTLNWQEEVSLIGEELLPVPEEIFHTEKETGLVLMGITEQEDLDYNLNLEIPLEYKAKNIEQQIINRVLNPIFNKEK